MNFNGITILGLGPGNLDLLTLQAWQILENSKEIYLRTRQHPVVADLPAQIELHSFDHLYESCSNFEDVYQQIVEQVLTLGRRPQGVIYAVPGHPLIAEATTGEILRRAQVEGILGSNCRGVEFFGTDIECVGAGSFSAYDSD